MQSQEDRFKNSEDAIQRVEATLQTVANNHLNHIQSEVEKTNELLAGVRDDLRLVLFGKMSVERE